MLFNININTKSIGVLTARLPQDTLGRKLFGEESPDLELEGKRKDTRHKFRQVQASRIAQYYTSCVVD